MIELVYDAESANIPECDIVGRMREGARIAAELCGLTDGEVSLAFVSGEEIRSLNASHLGKDSVTDVLSFPQSEAGAAKISAAPEVHADVPVLLGDVVICTERATAQANELGHSDARELVYLFVHGMLHLLGYDHEDPEEKKAMREKEEAVMSAIEGLRGALS